jgi:hypothetical protein
MKCLNSRAAVLNSSLIVLLIERNLLGHLFFP